MFDGYRSSSNTEIIALRCVRVVVSLLLDNRLCNLTPKVAEAISDPLLIRATPKSPQNKVHVEGAFGWQKKRSWRSLSRRAVWGAVGSRPAHACPAPSSRRPLSAELPLHRKFHCQAQRQALARWCRRSLPPRHRPQFGRQDRRRARRTRATSLRPTVRRALSSETPSTARSMPFLTKPPHVHRTFATFQPTHPT